MTTTEPGRGGGWSLDGYLTRIAYTGPRRPTVDVLRSLCRAHAAHIPFETLDAPEGRCPELDLDSVYDKVVVRRCGGACLEVSVLLAEALRAFGFATTTASGQAWRLLERRYSSYPNHMVLIVRAEQRDWLVDAGFATLAPVDPVPMDGTAHERRGWHFRVRRDDAADGAGLEAAQRLVAEYRGEDGRWEPLYRFEPRGRSRADFEAVRDHYLRGRASPVSRAVMCARTTRTGRLSLLNEWLLTFDAGRSHRTRITTVEQARDALARVLHGHEHLAARGLDSWRRLFGTPSPARPSRPEPHPTPRLSAPERSTP